MASTEIKDGDTVAELPSGDRVLYRDTSHRYWLLDAGAEVMPGAKVHTTPLVGVTSIIGCLDKPSLLPWVEEQTCVAVQALAGIGPVPLSSGPLRAAMREAQVGWQFTRDKRATSGTSIHDALELLAREGRNPRLSDFPEQDRGFVRALASFWLDARPDVIATEVVVASGEHGIAGRLDLHARIMERDLVVDAESGERATFGPGRFLFDAKTSKAVYPVENFAQLAGYELLFQESHDARGTDGQIVLRLDESGSYEVALSTATPDDFLAILGAYEAAKRLRASRPRKAKRDAVRALPSAASLADGPESTSARVMHGLREAGPEARPVRQALSAMAEVRRPRAHQAQGRGRLGARARVVAMLGAPA